jgi:hypothetical protein
MVDVSTANTVGLRTGTNWTINVTATNLDSDLSVKDFIVLHNNILVDNTSYVKTSRTVLTYNGAALPTNTSVEIRRKTPVNPVQEITYGARFSSALWNAELERTSRWKAETEVNGSGLSGLGVPIPKDDAFGALWASDIVFPPTRKSVYDKIITMPTLASAPFSDNPTVPDIAVRESSLRVANTKYIDTFYAAKDSPILTGSPSAPTRTQGDSSTGIATTAFVAGERVLWGRHIASGSVSVARGLTNKAVVHTLPTFTCPAGYTGGLITFSGAVFITANDTLLTSLFYGIDASVNGAAFVGVRSMGTALFANYADNYIPCSFTSGITLVPGSTYTLRFYFSYGGGANATKTFQNDGSDFTIFLLRSNAFIL